MLSRASDGDARAVSLSWIRRRGRDSLLIKGIATLEGQPPAGLAVYPAYLVDDALAMPGLQPLAGRFAVDGQAIRFTPALPFVAGMTYALVERGSGEARAHRIARIARPARVAGAQTVAAALYPTARTVPLNLLKIYAQFSGPMTEGQAARAVEVMREDTGAPLEDVFYQGGSELWDPARARLTLLLDPGRIKRGLAPHEAMGYPLVEGASITVTISERFRDADGAPLARGVSRRYRVGPAMRRAVDPDLWRITWPAALSAEPLDVRFDRPMDHALLQSALIVTDGEGAPVAGRIEVGPQEVSWRFFPDRPWARARHALRVEPHLEDLAGNSLVRVFDRDLARPEDTPRRSGAAVYERVLEPKVLTA
jgi:hypothetical protein